MANNLNYNAQVVPGECNKTYSQSLDFSDGVNVSFAFVPNHISDTCYNSPGEKCSDVIMSIAKNETNSQVYSNNNFSGWIAMKKPGRHTLILVARRYVDEGYYEVIGQAEGDSKTDEEFKKMIEDIIQTFTLK